MNITVLKYNNYSRSLTLRASSTCLIAHSSAAELQMCHRVGEGGGVKCVKYIIVYEYNIFCVL